MPIRPSPALGAAGTIAAGGIARIDVSQRAGGPGPLDSGQCGAPAASAGFETLRGRGGRCRMGGKAMETAGIDTLDHAPRGVSAGLKARCEAVGRKDLARAARPARRDRPFAEHAADPAARLPAPIRGFRHDGRVPPEERCGAGRAANDRHVPAGEDAEVPAASLRPLREVRP